MFWNSNMLHIVSGKVLLNWHQDKEMDITASQEHNTISLS